MLILGFAFHRGEVRAKRMAKGKFLPGPAVALPLFPAKTGSIEALFHEGDLHLAILDFRRVPKSSALGNWLRKPRMHRSIGAGYNPDQCFEGVSDLPQTYDGIIFIAESTAAKPILSKQ
jgi:erythromycin esterase